MIYIYVYITEYVNIYMRLYISEHKQNADNDGNRAQPLKRLLETLFLAIKKGIGFTTDVM